MPQKDGSISLNKYISSKGICSRREADRWIEEGRVLINNKKAIKGNRVTDKDVVKIDGKPLKIKKKGKFVYLAVNKAPGITCTTDLNDPDNIISYVNFPVRIFPVGRLDKSSSGLILMTDDGDIVNKILDSSNNNEKEYIVTVDKPINNEFLKKMAGGVHILGKKTKRCVVQGIAKNVFRIILTQGMNRQIRRMCDHFEYKVLALKRVRVMNIKLDDLPMGYWKVLTDEEVSELKQQLT
ncbi:UNVERIFIED_CONTAM: hypothetical protein GTU68_023193 [Idotea baltica]|nr:hypothetical protein [Idotea baltica]